jgi:hypothetical protein
MFVFCWTWGALLWSTAEVAGVEAEKIVSKGMYKYGIGIISCAGSSTSYAVWGPAKVVAMVRFDPARTAKTEIHRNGW